MSARPRASARGSGRNCHSPTIVRYYQRALSVSPNHGAPVMTPRSSAVFCLAIGIIGTPSYASAPRYRAEILPLLPGGSRGEAFDVNATGMVAGACDDAQSQTYPFA